MEDTYKRLSCYRDSNKRQKEFQYDWTFIPLLPGTNTIIFIYSKSDWFSLLIDSILVNLPIQWNLFVIPKPIFGVLFQSFPDMHREAKNLSHPTHPFLAKGEQGNIAFLFQLSQCKTSFCSLFSAAFFNCFCFFVDF